MTPPKLALLQVFRAAFALPWQKRGQLLPAIGLPMIVLLAVVLVWEWVSGAQDSGTAEWMLYGTYYVLFVMVAVRCHRVFLLGDRMGEAGWLPRWRWHDTHFALLVVVIWIMAMIGWVALMTIGFNAVWTGDLGNKDLFRQAELVAWLPGLYLASRFVLLLPAAAIDRPVGFGGAWALSQGNGLRLAVIAFGLPWAFSLLVSLLYRIDNGPFMTVFALLIANSLVVIEVAAISLAYQSLVTEKSLPSG